MISVKEIQLFSGTAGSTNIMSMHHGAYITGAFIMHGSVYVSVLCDDSKPYVNRKFHLVCSFMPISTQPGKRCWHIGTVGVNTSTPGTSYHYYIIEEEV